MMQWKPTVRKEPAASHRYGKYIARHGYVYAAYDGAKLVAMASTAGEVRKLYREAARAEMANRWHVRERA